MNKKSLLICSLLLLVNMLFASVCAAEAQQQELIACRYEQMVKDSLDALSAAYEQKDLRAFMHFVSPDFVGDDFLLYRAVRRDFRFFDNIDLRLDVDGFAINNKGRAQVTVKYNRSVIANKDGRSYKDNGLTQLTFHICDGQAKLYEMKFPLIFGLSEGLQVASGVVRTAEISHVLVVDRRGNVSVLPFQDALQSANGSSVIRGMVHMTSAPGAIQGFSFADNTTVTGSTLRGDVGWSIAGISQLMLKPGTKCIKLTAHSLDSVSMVPEPATYSATTLVEVVVGEVYALQLAGSNKFAVIEIVSIGSPTAGGYSGAIRYKYQPSGSRYF